MHYRLNFLLQADSKEDAREYVEQYFSEPCDWFDYAHIGGRWDNDGIKGNVGLITKKYYETHLKEYEGVVLRGGEVYTLNGTTSAKEVPLFDIHLINETPEPVSPSMIGKYYCVIVDYHN